MRVLVVHDGPLELDKYGRYHAYGYETMDIRYSVFSENISFLVRINKTSSESKMSLIPKSINVIEVPNFKKIRGYFCAKKKAKKIIEETVKNSDFIILKMHSSNAYMAFKYARKYRKPFLSEFVSCAWDSYWNYSLLGKLIAPFMELQSKIIAKNSLFNYYVTTSFLQKHYPSKGISLGCSDVSFESVDDRVLQDRFQKIENCKKYKKIILGTAASLDVKYKGQQYVIKALNRLRKRGYDVEYHLAGGHNPNNNYLFSVAEKYDVKDFVVYEGMFNNVEIKNFYDNIDIYIQPSKQEGLPRSVVEAMSRGCPVLGSRIAGIPELIDEQFMFKKGNVIDIENKIKQLLDLDLEKVAQRNFEKAKEFDEKLLNNKRMNFYSNIRNLIRK